VSESVWIATSETSNEGGFVIGVARSQRGAMALADDVDHDLAGHTARFGGWQRQADGTWERWTSESAFYYQVKQHKVGGVS
jgi:hypothetical protein